MAMLKLGLKLFFTSLIGVCLGMLLLEALLHAAPSVLPIAVQNNLYLPNPLGVTLFSPVMLVRDADLGWKLRPNIDIAVIGAEGAYRVRTIQIGRHDDIGFRDDGLQPPVYAMAVGDSFTEGWSIDSANNWVERLEKRTAQDWVNMGTRGWSSRQITEIIQTFMPELKPSLVVWAFFINDFGETGLHNQILQDQAAAPIATALNQLLQNRSAVWELGRFGLQLGLYRVREPKRTYHYTQNGLNLLFFPDLWDDQIDPSNDVVRDGMATTEKLILATNQRMHEQGHDFLFLIAPAAEQVYLPLLRTEMEAAAFEEAMGKTDFSYLDKPTDHLVAFCREQGLRCLDLTPAFRTMAAQQVQLYIPGDQHWNEAGNQLAADTIYDYLVTNHLLP